MQWRGEIVEVIGSARFSYTPSYTAWWYMYTRVTGYSNWNTTSMQSMTWFVPEQPLTYALFSPLCKLADQVI